MTYNDLKRLAYSEAKERVLLSIEDYEDLHLIEKYEREQRLKGIHLKVKILIVILFILEGIVF
jgi:hypothetical protein